MTAVGIWNERGYTTDYIVTLRQTLDGYGFADTAIVAHDAGWDVADDVLANATVAAAVDVLGAHVRAASSARQFSRVYAPCRRVLCARGAPERLGAVHVRVLAPLCSGPSLPLHPSAPARPSPVPTHSPTVPGEQLHAAGRGHGEAAVGQ